MGAHALLDLVAQLSARSWLSGTEEAEGEARVALRRIRTFFDLDRCVLYRVDAQSGSIAQVQTSSRAGARKVPSVLNARQLFPWSCAQVIDRGKVLRIVSVDQLPASAATDRKNYATFGTRSLVVIPMAIEGVVRYLLTFSSTRHEMRWPVVQIRHLKLLAECLVGAVSRKFLEAERSDSLRFERLITAASARLADSTIDQIDRQVRLAMDEVESFTGADQVGIFSLYPETGQAFLRHLVHAPEVDPPASRLLDYGATCPWLYEQLVRQQRVYGFRRHEDLPPEADADSRFLASIGIRSGLFIPLRIDGSVSHVLGLVSNTGCLTWTASLVERLEVLGGILLGALQRKRGTEEMQADAHRLGESQRIARLGSWEWDVATGQVELSSHALAIVGRRVGAIGDWMVLVHPDDRDRVHEALATAVVELQAAHRVDYRIVRPDGAERIIEHHLEAIRQPEVAGPRLLGTMQDVTERRQSERELDRLRREQLHSERIVQTGLLLASIAHELSQPLTAIRSNAQAALRLLAADALEPGETRAILTDIIADNKRASEIIATLRRAMRRQDNERAAVDLGQVVVEVFRLLRAELLERGVEVMSECPPGSYAIVDRTQIQQVILNLFVNAIEAMQPVAAGQRYLRVTVGAADAGSVRITVRDSGVGIAREDLNRVFDAFWTTKAHGTGMGLPVCKTIVELHGGRIWAEPNDGAGCAFFVVLPAAASPAPA